MSIATKVFSYLLFIVNFRSTADTSNFDFDMTEDSLTPTATPKRPPGASRLTGSTSRELKGSGTILWILLYTLT